MKKLLFIGPNQPSLAQLKCMDSTCPAGYDFKVEVAALLSVEEIRTVADRCDMLVVEVSAQLASDASQTDLIQKCSFLTTRKALNPHIGSRVEWEGAVTDELSEALECPYGDASGIMEAHQACVGNCWESKTNPRDAAMEIVAASTN